MDSFQFSISICSLIVVSLIVFIVIIRKSENKTSYLWIFLIGAVGWLIAFFIRLIPLQLIHMLMLLLLGVDVSNPENIKPYASHPLLLIWGPIFAGIFEELMRYLCISQFKDIKKDKFRGPFVLGLGWTTGEIIYLYGITLINILSTPDLTWTSEPWVLVAAGPFERLSASILHLSLSFFVFYSIYEKRWSKKYGLWLAILLHFAFDFIIVIWVLSFASLSFVVYIWTLEIAFFTCGIVLALITKYYWIPKQQKTYLIPQNHSSLEEYPNAKE